MRGLRLRSLDLSLAVVGAERRIGNSSSWIGLRRRHAIVLRGVEFACAVGFPNHATGHEVGAYIVAHSAANLREDEVFNLRPEQLSVEQFIELTQKIEADGI